MKFYVVAVNTRTHEEWDEGSFDNIHEACDHARACWDHLTKYEQREQQIEVRQYAGDIEDEDAPDSAFDYDDFDWNESQFYMNFDTGRIFSLKELEKAYNDQKHELDYDTFDEWLDKMLDLGRQKVGGLVEI
jgi:hypothetical protein